MENPSLTLLVQKTSRKFGEDSGCYKKPKFYMKSGT